MADKINGRTPEEIKRGLECCTPRYESNHWVSCSSECPFMNEGAFCGIKMQACVSALIRQLERERDAAVARCVNADDVSAGYYQEIRQLEAAQPKWISVEERLPEESVTVLVYRDGCCGVARLLDVEPVIMWTYTGFGGDPTHWMPLPEPPKEGV